MNPLLIAKAVTGLVVSSGATKIVKDIVANNVTTNTKLQEFVVKAGTYAIGSTVGAVAVAHLNKKIDRGMVFVNQVRRQVKEAKQES